MSVANQYFETKVSIPKMKQSWKRDLQDIEQ